MFNVTVLKMKDIKKYVIGIVITIILIIVISKYLPQVGKEEKIIQKLVPENSMLGCLDTAVPTISSINEEYKQMENEQNEITEDKFLQGILKTQISSIKGMENIEEKERIAKEEQEKEEEKAQNENKIEVARNRFENSSNNE